MPKKYDDAFKRMKSVEMKYARSLRKIAAEVGRIVDDFSLSDNFSLLNATLQKYADLIRPWARARAAVMVGEVDYQSVRQWRKATAEMSGAIKQEIYKAPTGQVMRALMAEQVELITSIPTKAAERVHKLVIKGITNSTRASEVAKEIGRTSEVTKARATLIARTETARAQASLTQARAQYIGADSYIWRTAEDTDVRETHKKLNGKVFRYDDPPECDPGIRANPGETYNCRCVALPIIPETIT